MHGTIVKAMQDGFEVGTQSSTSSGSCRVISVTGFLDEGRDEIGYKAPGSVVHGKSISLVRLNVGANRNRIPPGLTDLTATSYSARKSSSIYVMSMCGLGLGI